MIRNQAGKELTDRVREIRDRLTTGLVERDVAVRLALLAALSGEHLLLVGPPGTAKSFVARHLWVTEDFAEPASRGLQEAGDEVEGLLARLARVTKNFESLPREEEHPPGTLAAAEKVGTGQNPAIHLS